MPSVPFAVKHTAAWLLTCAGVVALFRFLNRHRAKVLLYHGVVEEEPGGILNADGLHVPAGAFARQMAWLRRHYRVVSAEEFAEARRLGRPLEPYTVVITFDDGYRNTYANAVPVLQRLGLPATFFVTTSFISSSELLWLDQLESLVDRTRQPSLALQVNGRAQRWPLDSTRAKRSTLTRLKRTLKVLPQAQRHAAFQTVVEQLGVSSRPGDAHYCDPLSWEHVTDMASRPGLRIGSHAVHHDNLDTLEPGNARQEISESKTILEQKLGRPVEGFAYPGGAFTQALKPALRDAGYRYAVTTVHGFNDASTDLFELRRNEVANRGSLPLFAATVSGTLDALKAMVRHAR